MSWCDAGRGVAAVGDEQLRQRRHVAREQRRDDGADDDRQRAGPGRARTAGFSRPTTAARARAAPTGRAEMISACCECWLPSQVTRSRLPPSGADDRADGVGGVDAADESRRDPAPWPRPRRARAGSSRPTGSRRQHDPERADEIELEVVPGARRDRRIDRPERQRRASACRRPRRSRRTAASGTSRARCAAARGCAPASSRRCCRCRCRSRKTARISEKV